MRTKFWYGVSVLASLVAGAGAAGAADLAVKAPVYKAPPVFISDWAGFYLGVAGGYGWAETSFDAPFSAANAKPKGGIFGGYAGYNWQYGSVVTGVEVDFSGADIKTNQLGLSEKTNELASARARLGYAFSPNWLAYGTAGAGWGHSTLDAGFPIGSASANQFGWVAGAGVEYKFYNSWILRAEYLHYDFEKQAFSFPVAISPNMSETVDLVRGGISYKF
jgi:outer membrane immunogenic protein